MKPPTEIGIIGVPNAGKSPGAPIFVDASASKVFAECRH